MDIVDTQVQFKQWSGRCGAAISPRCVGSIPGPKELLYVRELPKLLQTEKGMDARVRRWRTIALATAKGDRGVRFVRDRSDRSVQRTELR